MNSTFFFYAGSKLCADWITYAHSTGHNTTGLYLFWNNFSRVFFFFFYYTNVTFFFFWPDSIWRGFIMLLFKYLRGLLYFSALLSSGHLLLSLLWLVHTILLNHRPKWAVAQIARTLCLLLLGMFRKQSIQQFIWVWVLLLELHNYN